MNVVCKRFQFDKDELRWNKFLLQAKNSSFLFNRSFMDYHKDRFIDHSIMIYNEKGNLIACFPANEIENCKIYSHLGLTYGAFILKKDLKLPIIIEIYNSILKYFFQLGYGEIYYKAFPRMYNKIPSDEIEYCLFLSNARLYKRDTALVISQKNPVKYSGNIKRESKKAQESGIYIEEESDFSKFWNNILTPNLQAKYGIDPVHSLVEIQQLKNNFPNLIKLFVSKNISGVEIAGTVIFEINDVAHCQYISSTNEGRNSGALNYLFIKLIDNIYNNALYFDFGIANENNGKDLNHGLLAWKERMGGRVVSHDFYKIETDAF